MSRKWSFSPRLEGKYHIKETQLRYAIDRDRFRGDETKVCFASLSGVWILRIPLGAQLIHYRQGSLSLRINGTLVTYRRKPSWPTVS